MANHNKKTLIGKTILLVDDDPLISRMYEQTLIRAGANVISASNGFEGLKKLEENKVDLILLDIMMPQMNGYEMLKRLRENPLTKGLLVAMLTNLEDRPGDLEKLKSLGVKHYFIKSKISLKNLVSDIVKCLE